ncbi:MAG: hypothetical protein IPP42_22855 [Saprospiraceae bacterium]|nr:hypothetical protein [Saprospiraceae bacterium]
MLASTVSPDDMALQSCSEAPMVDLPGPRYQAYRLRQPWISVLILKIVKLYMLFFPGFGYGTHVYKSTDAGSSWKI